MSATLRKMGSSLAHQLYLLLRDDILRGRLAADAQLPGEKLLAESHGVSRITVRKALERLEAENLVRRVHGSGTYVAPQARPGVLVGRLEGFFEQSDWLSRNTDVSLVELGEIVPPEAVAEAMRLANGETVQRSIRLRRYADKPCLLLETFVPMAIAAGFAPDELEHGSLQAVFRRLGIAIGAIDYSVSAAPADPRLASLLDVPVATALMAMVWTFRSEDGRVVEYQYAHARPDVYALHTSLRPAP